jgi:L-seryl-tRNA(Ser) seleniumtransferase
MKANHLTRALRVDKMTLCALEATLKLYRDEERALKEIPTLNMLTRPLDQLSEEADLLIESVRAQVKEYIVKKVEGASEVGGGSMPLEKLPTFLMSVEHPKYSANKIVSGIRAYDIPVIARVEEDKVLFDPRTLQTGEYEIVAKALASLEQEV